jgi:hypothetical protein
MGNQPTPFELVFAPFVPERFEAMRAELAAAGVEIFDREAWVLSRPGAELLHELRPEQSLGEGVEELVALAHAAFLFWQQGERVVTVSREMLGRLVRDTTSGGGNPPGRGAYYVELAARRIWGTPVEGQPPEPLDGWFAVADKGRLDLVAIFGLLPGRPGLTAVHVAGEPPAALARADGSPVFSPVLDGGAAAGLWSVVGAEEILELGWRVHAAVGGIERLAAGRQEVAG